MIEAYRVVEDQTASYNYAATTSAEEAAYLKSVLEIIKPKALYPEWHRLIATPFRYPLPVGPAFQARFKPPFSTRNALYCSKETETALYEHAYYFRRERIGRTGMSPEVGRRTIFSLGIEAKDLTDISNRSDIEKITDRKDYSASWEYAKQNQTDKVIAYPSCRDPKHRTNYAAFAIESLSKAVGEEKQIECYFDPSHKSVQWIAYDLEIPWTTVS